MVAVLRMYERGAWASAGPQARLPATMVATAISLGEICRFIRFLPGLRRAGAGLPQRFPRGLCLVGQASF
ncbi:hypothetical protein STVA_22020 [Allostella vacuolata]|nr:hypothetical protein STVA_22020 [Stella vacuolata]